MSKPFGQPVTRDSSRMKDWRTSWPRGSMRRVASKHSRTSTSEELGTATSDGGPMARCGGARGGGADGKVRGLTELYPSLREDGPAPESRTTSGAPVEQLDLATVLK